MVKGGCMTIDIFKSFQFGSLELANRIVMAPMTRNRANEEGLVTDMMVKYYQQRATAGLIIAESAPVSKQGIGYPNTPGLFTESQADSWKPLIEAVHAEGGYIFAQLQHCGRISHSSMQPNKNTPIAPSALSPEGQAVTYAGMQDFETPRALDTQEISLIVDQFHLGAEMAKRAGFDGIEVHAANGYIIDQFLRDGSNQRSDAYGGNIENRIRLLNEILDSVCTVWSVDRVGVRLSPENSFNSMIDSNPQVHFEYIVEKLNARNLAYVHVLEGEMMTKASHVDYSPLRAKFSGTYIGNNGYDLEKAKMAIESGEASLVAFGIPFLANPDLVHRYHENLPLNEADPTTFYGGNEIGYTDYASYHCEEAII
jgi:N-ethylmaleimide reductase